MKIRIDNRVRLDLSGVPKARAFLLVQELLQKFTYSNPAFEKAARMGMRTTEPPDIATYKVVSMDSDAIPRSITFPRGGHRKVRKILAGLVPDFDVEFTDDRTEGDPHLAKQLAGIEHNLVMRDYQAAGLSALIAKQNAILRAPTGSGKTSIGIATVAALKLPTIVVVNAKVLVEQWVERAVKELGMNEEDVGRIGDGQWKIRPLTIALQQTLASRGCSELVDLFGVVICDEVHTAAADTMFAALDDWPAKYRFGISADETRADRKEFLVYDLFGTVAYEVERSKLIDEGHVLDVEILVLPTEFGGRSYRASMAKGKWAAGRAQAQLIESMTTDASRNDLILKHARIELESGQQVMLLTQRVEHARTLDQRLSGLGYRSGVMIGKKSGGGAEFERTRQGLLDGSYRASAGTIQIIGQGLDLPSLGVGFITTPLAGDNARQKFGQARGRFCRPGKERARLYYVWDRDVFGKKHLANLIKWNTSVRVYDRGQWVDAKAYLKAMPSRAA